MRLIIVALAAVVTTTTAAIKEEKAQIMDHHPRFITGGSTVNGELLVALPMTFFLPTLTLNNHRRRLIHDDDDDVKSNSIDGVLGQLGISSSSCRSRIVCEVVMNPNEYAPLSNIIFLLFRNQKRRRSRLKKNRKKNDYDDVNYYNYYNAFKIGTRKGNTKKNCEKAFPDCKFNAKKLINMEVLKFWQKLSDKMPIKITQ